MKLHYTNILLFSLPLNILVTSSSNVNNQRNHYITLHTTTRLLCECDLYMPNYNNDPEMKAVMQDFDRQTSQRFEEYNERIIKNRQKCKEECEKDIQKIILKDKIEKELAEKFVNLETNIDTNAIPTCVCEKSVADKVEKTCLKCGVLGGGVAPAWGLVSGLGYAGWSHYAATTLVKIATDEGIKKGLEVGLANVAKIVTKISSGEANIPAIKVLQKITEGISAKDVTLSGIFKTINSNACGQFDDGSYAYFSTFVEGIAKKPSSLKPFAEQAEAVSTAFNKAQTGVLEEGAQVTSSLTTAIIASVVAIVIIVLVMIIIYLILRYRRNKKMKKKLQYIKLLKE